VIATAGAINSRVSASRYPVLGPECSTTNFFADYNRKDLASGCIR
jgi:hypothetical protein